MKKVLKLKIGREDLILETGLLAKQANGAVLATYGGSTVLATVCCSNSVREDLDFIPLSVEYNEKYYAAGKIPGGFIKREGKPKDKEVLVSRLIDRPMRPLFDKRFGREIQVVPTTLSTDQMNPPDIVGMNAAFASVFLSDIPFDGPIAAVRIAYLNNEFIVNPSFSEIENSVLDIVVAGSLDGITMVEGGANEVSEEVLISAIDQAYEYIKQICNLQKEFISIIDKREKLPLAYEERVFEFKDELKSLIYSELKDACFVRGKLNRDKAIKLVQKKAYEHFSSINQVNEDSEFLFYKAFDDFEREIVRKSILEDNLRTDGRTPTQIRNIVAEVDLLKRTHGSALFTRGETQTLAVTTLGTSIDEQIMDDIDGDKRLNFMLHYNFPPFSVGETGRLMTGRREIGHGHLAQRSLEAMLPKKDDFPYTIRVVSEVLESNGSSSMATVCSGSMSLMAAGVPVKEQVAGIAMGLVNEGDKYVVLSDILGEEDHLGDMDFKVAGTKNGITGFQMDIKISNVTRQLMKDALEQARIGRMHILSIMDSVISRSRDDISVNAPKIIQLQIDIDKISLVIGSTGKTVKAITDEFEVRVQIEQDGRINLFGTDSLKMQKAKERIESIVREPKIGEIYEGIVKKINSFGAFIELTPIKEGFLSNRAKLRDDRYGGDIRNSKYGNSRHSRYGRDNRTTFSMRPPRLEEGQMVKVKISDIDKFGKIELEFVRD
ncbi:polyribonucleotide nucleotidyltransferase [Borrelia miyamotoi]|uniref:Polyribonucleotide nucleotidyltransferase n=1 Tax=Borrelia miyamotoi TaxID=47466 RepID=A0AAP9CGF8_9SPIR|nr:polyribonucleotide nucleotidyltransferase [Borrelia miyamotoi]ATQ15170.2 polyribonucleotide nucleotidyltransferase [Borrelia miyamotoi]ATQ16352.2 polyribonucleotide nucleotidyltransferase [Borrelia miyamotoi]ATQ17495.2 polyribonucleotide nucleotidyltransferase [Borrelia miyamotoi]ATQ18789.2 polyribonucleotide nucleotidyltransferase [Borrelia miyamotoi]ATQ19991.2 polyribonucleotide nucleotidyltransferase [Borrelia miyamotoi]